MEERSSSRNPSANEEVDPSSEKREGREPSVPEFGGGTYTEMKADEKAAPSASSGKGTLAIGNI